MEPNHPLVLIRHGEAEHHVRSITGGWTDTDLTEKGVLQSSLLSARLSRELDGVSVHLGSSNLRRAMQTAQIISNALGVDPQVYPALTDLNNGVAAGRTHAEAKALAIPPSEPLLDWQPYPQAESWRQFFTRVTQFMDEFSAQQGATTLLVTHSATVHAIIEWWLGLPVDSPTYFDVDPASITVLRLSRWGERSVERLNDTAHLYVQGLSESLQL
jgi:probable phosphoglycerate mutase